MNVVWIIIISISHAHWQCSWRRRPADTNTEPLFLLQHRFRISALETEKDAQLVSFCSQVPLTAPMWYCRLPPYRFMSFNPRRPRYSDTCPWATRGGALGYLLVWFVAHCTGVYANVHYWGIRWRVCPHITLNGAVSMFLPLSDGDRDPGLGPA